MPVTSVTIELPKCEYCGSQMKFFDEAWVEDEYMLVANILCVNPQCVNSSAIHINAAQQSVNADEAICSAKYHVALAEKGDTRCGVCHQPLRQ